MKKGICKNASDFQKDHRQIRLDGLLEVGSFLLVFRIYQFSDEFLTPYKGSFFPQIKLANPCRHARLHREHITVLPSTLLEFRVRIFQKPPCLTESTETEVEILFACIRTRSTTTALGSIAGQIIDISSPAGLANGNSPLNLIQGTLKVPKVKPTAESCHRHSA